MTDPRMKIYKDIGDENLLRQQVSKATGVPRQQVINSDSTRIFSWNVVIENGRLVKLT
jgi:hypothetical protein